MLRIIATYVVFGLGLVVNSTAVAREVTLPGLTGKAVSDVHPVVLSLARDPTDGVLGETQAKVEGANFLRLRLTIVAPTTMAGVSVRILDAFGKDVETLDLAGTQGVKEIWTNLIPGNAYRIRVLGDRQPDGASVTVRDLVHDVRPIQALSIIGEDNREAITKVTDTALLKAARATAKLIYQDGTDAYVCTAFLIGPQLMITNQHCMENPSVCPSVVVQFDLDKGQVVPVEKQRRCAVAKAIDYDLDFAVFELDRAPDAAITPLQFAAASPAADTALILVEHPAGEAKQVSRIDCKAIANPVAGRGAGTDFTHSCDSLGGSSGSGLLDSQLMVAGLHHFGIGGDEPTYNRAVRVEPIVAKLRDLQLIAAGGNP